MNEKVKTKEAETPSVENDLTEGLEETFPASDPPASTQPGSGRTIESERTQIKPIETTT